MLSCLPNLVVLITIKRCNKYTCMLQNAVKIRHMFFTLLTNGYVFVFVKDCLGNSIKGLFINDNAIQANPIIMLELM